MGTNIGPLAVRRSIWIAATPERVWHEFESFERMQAWFGTGHSLTAYEPRLGGYGRPTPGTAASTAKPFVSGARSSSGILPTRSPGRTTGSATAGWRRRS